eukprot:365945-Chlamydomonas_euryale.AAC.8
MTAAVLPVWACRHPQSAHVVDQPLGMRRRCRCNRSHPHQRHRRSLMCGDGQTVDSSSYVTPGGCSVTAAREMAQASYVTPGGCSLTAAREMALASYVTPGGCSLTAARETASVQGAATEWKHLGPPQ